MNIVETNLQELIGVICWDAKWDSNLNLSINFGQPSLSIREPKEAITDDESVREFFRQRTVSLKGEWLFWILKGNWKLTIRNFGEVTIASSYKRKTMALARLDGQKLTYASVNPHTCATQLEFDLGAKLTIRRRSINGNEDIWYLYKPNRYVLAVRTDGMYHLDPNNTSLDKIRWHSIALE